MKYLGFGTETQFAKGTFRMVGNAHVNYDTGRPCNFSKAVFQAGREKALN